MPRRRDKATACGSRPPTDTSTVPAGITATRVSVAAAQVPCAGYAAAGIWPPASYRTPTDATGGYVEMNVMSRWATLRLSPS